MRCMIAHQLLAPFFIAYTVSFFLANQLSSEQKVAPMQEPNPSYNVCVFACLQGCTHSLDRPWDVRSTERVHRTSWCSVYFQPETSFIIDPSPLTSVDYGKTKGTAWDTATFCCWSTDGMEVLYVTQTVTKHSVQ